MNCNPLRKLARDRNWQILYNRAKEIGTVRLFNNDCDFTCLQLNFLSWLEIYSALEQDIALKKENIDMTVLEDDIRTDAYLYWRRIHEDKPTIKTSPKKGKVVRSEGSTVFTRK